MYYTSFLSPNHFNRYNTLYRLNLVYLLQVYDVVHYISITKSESFRLKTDVCWEQPPFDTRNLNIKKLKRIPMIAQGQHFTCKIRLMLLHCLPPILYIICSSEFYCFLCFMHYIFRDDIYWKYFRIPLFTLSGLSCNVYGFCNEAHLRIPNYLLDMLIYWYTFRNFSTF